jgi:hypothetical protein
MQFPQIFSHTTKPVQYRHGDVMLEQVSSLPSAAKPQNGAILARGELTGHSHRIAQASAAALFVHGNQTFVQILEPTSIIHEEHHAIPLAVGIYRFWMQREYHPKAIVTVRD